MPATAAELKTRTLSGLVLGAAVLFITWWNPISFAVMCAMAGIVLAREWWRLTKHRSRWFVPFGILYLGLPLLLLCAMRHGGPEIILMLFALVWSCDIGGYAFGTLFGKHKIAPTISPGKSWEGLIGSVIAAIVVAFCCLGELYHLVLGPDGQSGFNLNDYTVFCCIVGVSFAIVGLAGDLFESSLKRRAKVKDSGNLIPGHGGLFDRVDALLPCSIVMGIWVIFCGSLAHAWYA